MLSHDISLGSSPGDSLALGAAGAAATAVNHPDGPECRPDVDRGQKVVKNAGLPVAGYSGNLRAG